MNLDRLRKRFFEGVHRYRWLATIGRGGMGIVFKAQDLDLEEVVAIKILSPDWESDDQQLLTRFKREINLNRKIKHPNVARIHDFGMSGDFPYITMEYVPGRDLHTLIGDEGPLSQARAVSILRQIALGTEAAHKLGIIHRDLKSQNVMVEDTGAVAILDFGLARGKTNDNLTLDSVMVGTPHYMSPEQALGRSADARSDVYSIGVMAFECLTGRVPFDGESPLVIAMSHVSQPIPDDLKSTAGVSPELCAVVYKALAKDPVHRFASAADLEAELAMLRPFPAQVSLSGAALKPDSVTLDMETAHEHDAKRTAAASEETWVPDEPAPPATPAVPAAPLQASAAAPPARLGPSAFIQDIARSLAQGAPAPAPAPEAAPAPPAPPAASLKDRSPLVLIVDPAAPQRATLAEALSQFGCRALEAENGEAALEILLKNEADLVLMDVGLPGMDGFDVTRVLKSQPATTALPIVLTSARLDRSHFAFAIQSGAADFLVKPLVLESVVGRLWHILEHHGFTPPSGNRRLISAMRKTLPSANTPPALSARR
jgi:CheY-like chemotaxis protein